MENARFRSAFGVERWRQASCPHVSEFVAVRLSQLPARLDVVEDAVGQSEIAVAFRLDRDPHLYLRVHPRQRLSQKMDLFREILNLSHGQDRQARGAASRWW